MLNLKGKTLGRYHLVEPLGEGGMAVVYRAYDANLDRDVAIKVIRTEMGSDPSFLQRFQREARALAKLDHPYILKVLDYGEQEGLPYLVMPFVSGGTLKTRMGSPYAPANTAQMLAPIARALAYAHSQGIIHRDVKPANILITPSGAPILSDFGIAKLLETEGGTQLTATGVGMGTPDYMAPEQWLGTTDARSDVYALGVILYQMITGRLPYQADTPAAVLLKHMNDPLPRPSDFVPGLPDAVERVIFKALAKDAADRFQDMAQFAAALERMGLGEKPEVGLPAASKTGSAQAPGAAPSTPPRGVPGGQPAAQTASKAPAAAAPGAPMPGAPA
ncbi:MAG: serine/threonine protein kinase, partial [Chloroflexi bacterium]